LSESEHQELQAKRLFIRRSCRLPRFMLCALASRLGKGSEYYLDNDETIALLSPSCYILVRWVLKHTTAFPSLAMHVTGGGRFGGGTRLDDYRNSFRTYNRQWVSIGPVSAFLRMHRATTYKFARIIPTALGYWQII
jgi:hypothetical protein